MYKEKEILDYIKNNLIELLPLKGLNVEIMEEPKRVGNYRPDFEAEICY